MISKIKWLVFGAAVALQFANLTQGAQHKEIVAGPMPSAQHKEIVAAPDAQHKEIVASIRNWLVSLVAR